MARSFKPIEGLFLALGPKFKMSGEKSLKEVVKRQG